MPSNEVIESILKGKRDVSAYQKFTFQSTADAEKYEMIQKCFYSCQKFCISYNSASVLAQMIETFSLVMLLIS